MAVRIIQEVAAVIIEMSACFTHSTPRVSRFQSHLAHRSFCRLHVFHISPHAHFSSLLHLHANLPRATYIIECIQFFFTRKPVKTPPDNENAWAGGSLPDGMALNRQADTSASASSGNSLTSDLKMSASSDWMQDKDAVV